MHCSQTGRRLPNVSPGILIADNLREAIKEHLLRLVKVGTVETYADVSALPRCEAATDGGLPHLLELTMAGAQEVRLRHPLVAALPALEIIWTGQAAGKVISLEVLRRVCRYEFPMNWAAALALTFCLSLAEETGDVVLILSRQICSCMRSVQTKHISDKEATSARGQLSSSSPGRASGLPPSETRVKSSPLSLKGLRERGFSEAVQDSVPSRAQRFKAMKLRQ